MSTSVRLAIPSERAALEALQWRASLANPGDREVLLAHPDAIALPPEQISSGAVWVAERDGVILGFAALLDRPDQALELDGLFVEPACQRQRIGKALVERCVAVARERNTPFLEVIANSHAYDFYLSCGFTFAGTAQTRFGPAVFMRKAV